jgi:hypothetical protein
VGHGDWRSVEDAGEFATCFVLGNLEHVDQGNL